MSMKLSQIYGMEIYTEDAKKVGRVEDVILDLEKRKVWQLTLDPLKATVLSKIPPEDLLKRSVPYDKVKGVSDIVLVEPQGSKRTL
jgi:sporulation protein YlmC with PRC-barrel domain